MKVKDKRRKVITHACWAPGVQFNSLIVVYSGRVKSMNFYMKIFCGAIILLLPFSYIEAQRKKPVQKKSTETQTSRKATDSGLTPPPNRKFNHRFNIDVNYDKFENRTKVQLRLPINSIESVHFAYFFVSEKVKQAPSEIIFLFFKDAGREFLLPVKDFVVLTDKDRLRIKMVEAPELESDGKIPYLAKFDYPTFLRIANAKRLDMKIGDFEITFDEESIEALKDLASRTNPKFKETPEEAENQAAEKQLKAEVDKLYRTSSVVKSSIRETLESMRQALLISESSAEPKAKQSAVGQASRTFLENKDAIPNGIFKEMLDSAMKELVRADILNGVNAGVIDKEAFDTSEIVRQYNLSGVPEDKRPSVILSKARETLLQLYTIASMAKIIELE